MEVTDLPGRGRTQDVNAGSLAPETVVFLWPLLCEPSGRGKRGKQQRLSTEGFWRP